MDTYIFSGIINFFVVGIVFLFVLFIFMKISLKKYKLSDNKLKFYGLFLGLDNKCILSFSLVSLCYIFLIWCISSFQSMNIVYFLVIFFLILLSDIFSKNYKRIPVNLVFGGISSLLIFIISKFYLYLTLETANIFTLIILGLLIIFTFLFFTYCFFKLLNQIIIKNEYLKKRGKY